MRFFMTWAFLSFSGLAFCQSGIFSTNFKTCDSLVEAFRLRHNLPGLSIALAKDGKLLYHRGFGHADLPQSEPTQPNNLYRLASISKPITAIGILKLEEANLLSLNDVVFGPGGILKNHPGLDYAQVTDSRVYQITVRHLLEHAAGWNRGISCFPNPTFPYPFRGSGCDPFALPLHVTASLGRPNPAKVSDFIQFLLELGLDHNPGAQYAYSNIGYMVLGEIIEEVSGMSYEAYLQTAIFEPLGICDIKLGKSLLSQKAEREVEYFGNSTVLAGDGSNTQVKWQYGGWLIETMKAHGGWIASSRDLVRLLVAVDLFNSKPDILTPLSIFKMTQASATNNGYGLGWRVNSLSNWWHTGSMTGTSTFFARTQSGYTWALLTNVKGSTTNFWSEFDDLPFECIASVSNFPTWDLMDLPTESSSNIFAANKTDNSIELNWNVGNGNRRIVVAAKNGIFNKFPEDGVSYNADAQFGLGDSLSLNEFVVYEGLGNNVNVFGLEDATTYGFRIFEYNQTSNSGMLPLYRLCDSPIYLDSTSFSVNTAQQLIKIQTQGLSSQLIFSIYNGVGKLILKNEIKEGTGFIDYSHLPQGYYTCNLQSQSKTITQSLIAY